MVRATVLALPALFGGITLSFGLGQPTHPTAGDDEPDCLGTSDQPSQGNATIQSCQNGTANAICWPPDGAKLCYPQPQLFVWSPAYFAGKQDVHLFFNEDPSNLSASEIWIGSDPVGLGHTYEHFSSQEYGLYGPSHTFQVWAVGLSAGGGNSTIAPNPPTYTLVYAPASTPDYDSDDDYNSDDDDLSAGGWAAIVIAVFACVLGITLMSICCCRCCQGTRNRILPPSRRRPLSNVLGQQPVPFNQMSNHHERTDMDGAQITGFPRARLPDSRHPDSRWHIDEQLPAYQKEPTGESPPAYDHSSDGAAQNEHSSATTTGSEPRAEDVQQRDTDIREEEHVTSNERDHEERSNGNISDSQNMSTQTNTQQTT